MIVALVVLLVIAAAFIVFENKRMHTISETASEVQQTETTPVMPEGWKITTDIGSGVTFAYPEPLDTTYIHTVDWPPAITVSNDPVSSCTNAGSEIERGGKTERVVFSGTEYCMTKISEGAAGSTYTQYTYVNTQGEKTFILTFSLRSVQCGNYDDPQKLACEVEQKDFDINLVVDGIFATIH